MNITTARNGNSSSDPEDWEGDWEEAESESPYGEFQYSFDRTATRDWDFIDEGSDDEPFDVGWNAFDDD